MNYEKWHMHYETLPDGTRAQVRDGYTMRNGYYTRDGHGGHGFEHRQEMRQIALETIKEVVPQMIEEMCVQICTAALEDVIGAIEWDIEEVINECLNSRQRNLKPELTSFAGLPSSQIALTAPHSKGNTANCTSDSPNKSQAAGFPLYKKSPLPTSRPKQQAKS